MKRVASRSRHLRECGGANRERQRGSHIVMSRDNTVLVIPDHKMVAKGTERELIKDAGLTVGEFNTLLRK